MFILPAIEQDNLYFKWNLGLTYYKSRERAGAGASTSKVTSARLAVRPKTD